MSIFNIWDRSKTAKTTVPGEAMVGDDQHKATATVVGSCGWDIEEIANHGFLTGAALVEVNKSTNVRKSDKVEGAAARDNIIALGRLRQPGTDAPKPKREKPVVSV